MKIFQREQRSLFGEILDWMLTPLLLLWPVSLVLTWLVAQNVAGRPFDRALEYNVGALARLITVSDQRAQFTLPLPARELLRADDSDTVYYQILGPRGEFLSGERDVPLPPEEEKNIPQVCSSLDQALEHLDKDRAFLTKGGVFTDSYLDAYIDLKMQEVTRFRMATHPVEFDMYYSV